MSKQKEFVPTLRNIQNLVYVEYLKNGYQENWNLHKDVGDIAELGLIVSEVSESIEVLRAKYKRTRLGFELADIIIRVMNFASRKNIDLEIVILEKNKKNLDRGYLHGKKV